MKIPDKIRIGNHWYSVQVVREIPARPEAAGYTCRDNLEILLCDNYPPEMIFENFCHEVVHNMLDEVAEGKASSDERFVMLLSRQLYAFLVENNLWGVEPDGI